MIFPLRSLFLGDLPLPCLIPRGYMPVSDNADQCSAHLQAFVILALSHYCLMFILVLFPLLSIIVHYVHYCPIIVPFLLSHYCPIIILVLFIIIRSYLSQVIGTGPPVPQVLHDPAVGSEMPPLTQPAASRCNGTDSLVVLGALPSSNRISSHETFE